MLYVTFSPMKSINILALSLSLFLYAQLGNSQNYTPMLDTYNEWHFTTCFSGCLTDVYYTDGDTVVNGKTYKILDGFHYISRSFLIREDIATRKVYMLLYNPPAHSTEDLLYDFSIQVGDTMNMTNPISPFPYYPGKFICDSIVSKQLVDSNYYNHFYFHPLDTLQASSQNAVWIEGVGSLSLINAPGGEPDENKVGNLTCFFKDGVSFYQKFVGHPVCESTFKPNSIKVLDFFNTSLIHHLESKTIQIKTTKYPYNLKVIDLQGKQIGETIRVNLDSYGLNYSHFSSGLVLLQLQDENGNYSVIKTVIPR